MAPELLKVPINPESNYFNFSTKLYWRWSEDALFPVKYIRQKIRRKAEAQ
jgi:hypothetical protein